MESISENLLEVGKSFEQKYKPVLDFSGWKVAMLRHFDIVEPQNFFRVERHRNTNEIFILTAGKADLILFEGEEVPGKSHVFTMETNVAYNVLRNVWHHVVASQNAHIILFERSETSEETSSFYNFEDDVIEGIKSQFSFQNNDEDLLIK